MSAHFQSNSLLKLLLLYALILYLYSDVELKMTNMSYVFKPSKSGTFEESSMVCKAENMSLLEIHDQTSYEAVKKQALATGQDAIWLNMKKIGAAKKVSERHVLKRLKM